MCSLYTTRGDIDPPALGAAHAYDADLPLRRGRFDRVAVDRGHQPGGLDARAGEDPAHPLRRAMRESTSSCERSPDSTGPSSLSPSVCWSSFQRRTYTCPNPRAKGPSRACMSACCRWWSRLTATAGRWRTSSASTSRWSASSRTPRRRSSPRGTDHYRGYLRHELSRYAGARLVPRIPFLTAVDGGYLYSGVPRLQEVRLVVAMIGLLIPSRESRKRGTDTHGMIIRIP
jgi:hypothetical protein